MGMTDIYRSHDPLYYVRLDMPFHGFIVAVWNGIRAKNVPLIDT